MIQVFKALTRQPVSYEEGEYLSRVTIRLGRRMKLMQAIIRLYISHLDQLLTQTG